MNTERIRNELFEQVCDQIGRDGVHADHDQRERPSSVPFHINNPTECCEKQETDSTAEQRPARCPDSLNYRADSREMQEETGSKTDCARDQKRLHWNARGGDAHPT